MLNLLYYLYKYVHLIEIITIDRSLSFTNQSISSTTTEYCRFSVSAVLL